MPERFTEVTRVGWGKRIIESFWCVIFGMILFIASFAVLWINEGRMDMSKIAKLAIPVDPNVIEVTAEGKLISVTNELESAQTIGDPKYLKPGSYIKLVREVEMYAWIEKEEIKTEKKFGGEEVRTTTYTYTKGWTSRPEEASAFKYLEGHENPSMPVREERFFVQKANVGVYEISPASIDLPSPTDLSLTAENVILDENAKLMGDYVFIGQDSLAEPRIGDLRISFKTVMSGLPVTLFGKLGGGKVVPYYHKGEHRLYRVLYGSRDEAIAKMATEHKMLTWILRGVGFLMMWVGLCLFFGPINVILDIVPVLGGISRGLIGILMFILALVLSSVTIVISMIAHNIIALILVFIMIGGGLVWWRAKRKKRASVTK